MRSPWPTGVGRREGCGLSGRENKVSNRCSEQATDYTAKGTGVYTQDMFFFSETYRTILVPSHPLRRWVWLTLSPGLKPPYREVANPCSTVVKNEWSLPPFLIHIHSI
jgi:hypothetical protein